jgi:hypothetical protein
MDVSEEATVFIFRFHFKPEGACSEFLQDVVTVNQRAGFTTRGQA